MSIKEWPEWPIELCPDYFLVTPIDRMGWASLWRIQKYHTHHPVLNCDLKSVVMAINVTPIPGGLLGYFAAIIHAQQIVAVVTKPPTGKEFITWESVARNNRQAQPSLVVPRPAGIQ